MDVRGPYRIGGLLLLLSAALHIFAFVVGGFSNDALRLIPVGLVYALVAYGLFCGWRWLAYIAFVMMMIGGIAALSTIWSPSTIPVWWTILIIAADWLGAAALFGALWRSAPRKAETV